MLESRRREIRRVAENVREKCRVGRYGIIDLFGDHERLGVKLFRYPLGENAELGMSMKRDRDVLVITNSSIRVSRELFTLAHEIGHVYLHIDKTKSFFDNSKTLSISAVANDSEDEKEQEANYFAACLLMPEQEVIRYLDLELNDFGERGLTAMDIARIMSEFGVSFEMVLVRLESLGKIDANERNRLDVIKNERRVGNLLRSVGGNARLNEVSEEILIPHEYIDYAVFNYNRNAIPKETLEKVLECYQLTLEDISDKLVEKAEVEEDFDEFIRRLK